MSKVKDWAIEMEAQNQPEDYWREVDSCEYQDDRNILLDGEDNSN
jgi:hypothetical protein